MNLIVWLALFGLGHNSFKVREFTSHTLKKWHEKGTMPKQILDAGLASKDPEIVARMKAIEAKSIKIEEPPFVEALPQE